MPELTRRYVVMTMASEAPFDPHDPEGVFVLKPWKDPAALRALAAYREHCYPELARDLEAWIAVIEAGPALRGDVGRRNEAYVKRGGGVNGTGRPPSRPRATATTRRPAMSRKRPTKPSAKRKRTGTPAKRKRRSR